MSVLMNRRCSLDPGSAALAAYEYAGLVVYDAESAGRLRAGTLAEALTNIISDTALIKRVRKIRVCRSYLIAEIVWDDPEGFRSFFGVPGNQSSFDPVQIGAGTLTAWAEIGRGLIHTIHAHIAPQDFPEPVSAVG